MTPEDSDQWNMIYVALARSERRDLLQYLRQVPEARIEDVAERLLKHVDDSAEEESEAMILRFRHIHLPRLSEAGLVSWNSQQNRVTLTPLGSQLPADLINPNSLPSPDAGDRDPALG
jgi:hypothetical protein